MGTEGIYIGHTCSEWVHHMIDMAYPRAKLEHRYNLDGHLCLSEVDERIANQLGGSLLYGEVLPSGVAKLCDETHLLVEQAKIVYDFGAGTGKLCVQCFFQYPHLDKVVAVEISPSRYKLGVAAWRRLAKLRGFALIADNDFECVLLETRHGRRRTLEFKCCDVFDSLDHTSRLAAGDKGYVQAAEIIFLNTDFPDMCTPNLCRLFRAMRNGQRCATYSDVRKPYAKYAKDTNAPPAQAKFPLVQLSDNVHPDDRFATSWSKDMGHHFYCFVKGAMPTTQIKKK